MPTVTDDLLMAYVDDELDAADAARVAAAVTGDDALRQRVAALRRQRQQLRAAFVDMIEAPVPPGLAAAAHGPAARPATGARVVAMPRRWIDSGWARWGGLAACLMLVVGLWRPAVGPDSVVDADGRVLAAGRLAAALEQRLSADVPADDVHLHLSFADRDGRLCRSFNTDAVAGLACRDGQRWQLVVLTSPSPRERDDMRLAGSSLPAAVIDDVERRIDGMAFDARQEQAARDRGWRR